MDEPFLIDVRGLKCPLPVLKTAKRMAPLVAGSRVIVLTSDPMAAIDIPHFCQENGHRLLDKGEQDGALRFEIEKATAGQS